MAFCSDLCFYLPSEIVAYSRVQCKLRKPKLLQFDIPPQMTYNQNHNRIGRSRKEAPLKFGVIIVTYNRLALLKECVSCVLAQTEPFSNVCIIDNHSSDGTAGWLKTLPASVQAETGSCTGPFFDICRLEENLGGAGGFACGMKRLSDTDCDWILIIDDDAMIAPDYVAELKKAVINHKYLAYSGTVTTRGTIDTSHRRFLKCPTFMFYEPVPEAAYGSPSFEYDISTFCGLLIKTSLVREIGFPKTEYFIWFDDTEYCMRFHSRSRILNVNTAVLNHRTAPPGDAPMVSWKNYYGFRNAIDIGRTYSRHPSLYMAYIISNHLAHIVLDSFWALLGNQPSIRRYRAGIYKAVLKGLRQKPGGICRDYLPGSGPS